MIVKQPPAELSEKQATVLAAIRSYIAAHGYPPSIRELGETCGGVNTNTISGHLSALQKKGRIVRTFGVPRGIRLVETAQ